MYYSFFRFSTFACYLFISRQTTCIIKAPKINHAEHDSGVVQLIQKNTKLWNFLGMITNEDRPFCQTPHQCSSSQND